MQRDTTRYNPLRKWHDVIIVCRAFHDLLMDQVRDRVRISPTYQSYCPSLSSMEAALTLDMVCTAFYAWAVSFQCRIGIVAGRAVKAIFFF